MAVFHVNFGCLKFRDPLTSEIRLILVSRLLSGILINSLIRILLLLFSLRIRVALLLSFSRTWIRFLFIMVYIGGVLVLAIYTILSSSNWKFSPPIASLVLIYPRLVLMEKKITFSFFEGVALGGNRSLILFLLIVLLIGLLLLVKIIKI